MSDPLTIPLPLEMFSDDGDEATFVTSWGEFQWKLIVRPDDVTPHDVEDPEVFGRYVYVDPRDYDNNGYSRRPRDMDGAARKMHVGYHDNVTIWFQPPADLVSNPELLKAHCEYVRDVLTWGYRVLTVTLKHTLPTGYERHWVASLGGLSWSPDPSDIVDVVGNLVDEIIDQATTTINNLHNIKEQTS